MASRWKSPRWLKNCIPIIGRDGLLNMPQLSRQTGTSLSDINIVPFVDVMLVLLVIFMITAPILQSGIEVDVPRVGVSIDRAQRIYIGDDPVNIHELGDKVHAQMHNAQSDPIYLRCDKTVPFGSFALVVDTLRQSGIQNVSVVTEPLDEAPH
jgi:biopolymer transport protein TolR